MKKTLLIVIFFFVSMPSFYSQNLNLRFSTFFYGWERADSVTQTGTDAPKTLHVKGYQNLLLQANKNQWSFNTSIQTEEDVVKKMGRGFAYRFYNLYIKGSNLFNLLDIKAGRQYVYAGVGKGPIDGLYFKVKGGKNKEFQFTGFGGALTPYDYSFDNYPKIKENFLAGAQFTYFGVKNLMAAASFSYKKRKMPSYYALRVDSTFNAQEVLIDVEAPAEMLAGVDFNYTYLMKHNFYGKAYYDIKMKKFYRGEFNARINAYKNLNVSASYTYNQPQLNFNTIFSVFTHKQNQEIEGGVDYTLKNGINIFARVSDVLFDGDHSLRLQAGFNHSNYGLNFIRYMGYSGESDGVNGYYLRQIVPEILSTSVSLSYARYRLGDYTTEKVNSLSGMLGFTYRPNRQFTVDVQGQFIQNRVYKLDSRFLVGISYWLFKKL